MQSSEKSLLRKICIEKEISPQMVMDLIELEKTYANRNQARRRGLTQDLDNIIEKYL